MIKIGGKKYITKSCKETQGLGKSLALKIKKGVVVCLSGDLGTGKTTLAQGLLKGLKAKGPHTSPTFVVLKHYKGKFKAPACRSLALAGRQSLKFENVNIYHIDAYRVMAKDIFNLGWKELLAEKNNIIIIEWADRIKKIIPRGALWVKLEWLEENKRKITFK